MVVKTVTEKMEICDRCEGNITASYCRLVYHCPVCKRDVCINCRAGGIFEKYPDICRDCAELPEVKARKDKFIKGFWRQYKKEEAELSKIKVPKRKMG